MYGNMWISYGLEFMQYFQIVFYVIKLIEADSSMTYLPILIIYQFPNNITLEVKTLFSL